MNCNILELNYSRQSRNSVGYTTFVITLNNPLLWKYKYFICNYLGLYCELKYEVD